MTAKTHISIRDLSIHYGKTQVLNHISVDIPDKKITAIVGPSGCGKTTLLKSFNRLLDLQEGVKVSGEVLVDGENIYHPQVEITHLRKKMGLLSQRPQVLPMSIYENVVYGLRLAGEKNRSRLDQTVEKYLREAHLWHEVKDRLNASAARLSIGQQQRLCLARGLAVEPDVILGDEPTSALDPISAEQIEQLFLQLKERYTIILVTHILRQARRLADYAVFLYLGNLIEHGPAEQVFGKPRFAKTQSYIEGKFIEEPQAVHELDLRLSPDHPHSDIARALLNLEPRQILKVIVREGPVLNKAQTSVDWEGHRVLEIRRMNLTDWEILIQKQAENYII